MRVGGSDGCVHLRDPAGLIFCVVPVQSDDFEQHATTLGLSLRAPRAAQNRTPRLSEP